MEKEFTVFGRKFGASDSKVVVSIHKDSNSEDKVIFQCFSNVNSSILQIPIHCPEGVSQDEYINEFERQHNNVLNSK
jgi:hypothetical protein